jgi:glycosyltransferase involved in cell wall biosynthesis
VEQEITSGQKPSFFLSIIIPAYNEETRLQNTLPQVAKFLTTQVYKAEVVVVDDGSIDRTAEIVEQMAGQYSCIRLVRATHGGKGHAVKTGMLQVDSEYAFLCDADLAMPLPRCPSFCRRQNGYQIAIGSREGKGPCVIMNLSIAI